MIGVHLHRSTIMNQLHVLMVFLTYFIFETQINYTLFKKEFKVSAILCVVSFDIICSSNLPKIVYTIPWIYPNVFQLDFSCKK